MLTDQCINEKAMDIYSDDEPYDSDLIDSDVEAELYSVIHHETDNSINFESSCHSLNVSNKENSTTIFDYKEYSNSNGSFAKSNEIVLNNDNNNNPNNVQIIEIEDKLSDKIVKSPYNYTFFKNSLPDSPPKRKSNSDCFDLNDAQTSKKQKCNEQNTSKNKSNIVTANSNDTVVLSSSDEDDNDIICIEPLGSENHIETNVSQCITSDSESENSADSWCFKSSNVHTSTPSSSKKTKDQWFINDEDLYRSRRSSNRYHESQFTTCTRCNQKGHSAKFCSFSKDIKCFICGDNHSSFRCKNKICAKCFAFGHDIRYCPKRIDVCEMCHMPGHHQRICPDLWRRFQRTTMKKSKQIWRLYQDTPFFCYNCGLPGHFGAMCNSRRMNIPAFPTWPFVLNYKVQNQRKIKPKVNTPAEEGFNANNCQEQIAMPKKKKNKKNVKKKLSAVANVQPISFPRTPKISQVKPQNEKSCSDKDLTPKEKAKQESRRLKRLRRRQKKVLLKKKQQAITKIPVK